MNDFVLTVGVVQTAEDLLKVIALGGGLIVALFWMLLKSCTNTARTKQVERTRREIAAYVAEGTISPEQGERMMRIAGTDPEEA